jgi:hypothetical protein
MDKRLGGPRERPKWREEEKKPYLHQDPNSVLLADQPVACRYTDCDILTPSELGAD